MPRPPDAVTRRSPLERARGIASRLGRVIFRRKRLLIYRAPVAVIRRDPPRLDPGETHACAVLTLDEARAFAGAPAHVLARLAPYIAEDIPGERLLLFTVNGVVAGWCIVFVGARVWSLSETETTLPLGATDSIFISAYTLPQFRGRHINRALMGETARLATSMGATQLWAWHEHWNEAPRKNMISVGMTQVGFHERLWVLGVRLSPRIEMERDA